jgi:hypothetical protein
LSSIGQQTYKTSHIKPHGTISGAVTIGSTELKATSDENPILVRERINHSTN